MSYYYLVASLPLLSLGEEPPGSVETFRSQLEGLVTEEDLAEIDRVLAGDLDKGRSAFTRAWFHAETQIRNAVARIRAARLGESGAVGARPHAGFDVSIERSVAAAFEAANPLETERELDRLRWRIIGDLARDDPFGLPAVLAYALKIRMVERWSRMDAETGRERVESWVERLMAAARLAAGAGPDGGGG